ncbi:MAG: hypothetical protein BWX48_02211 [Verrucomicrobia bacterium ADurb.Bin006]|nr:MAG: hypothetical protein BWX48_02211 [Verrucomicrobia bacterium ADurb.Bin006]
MFHRVPTWVCDDRAADGDHLAIEARAEALAAGNGPAPGDQETLLLGS